MLFAFAVTADETLSPAALAELGTVATGLAQEYLGPGAVLSWQQPSAGPAGSVFWRGALPLEERLQVLWRVAVLRRLSQRFPGLTVMISGWKDLPPTQLRAGEFQLFGDTYEPALEALAQVEIRAVRRHIRR